MKKQILISLVFLTTSILSARSLTEADRVKMAECWFNNAYEYMFVGETQSGLRIGGKQFDVFTAGSSGILFYGGLTGCVGENYEREWGDVSPLEALSGLNAYQDGSQVAFQRINPDIIVWGEKNLIPSPESKVHGVSFQKIYEIIFQRFARLMYESYLSLQNEFNFKAEQKEYLVQLLFQERDSYDATYNYFDDRFGGKLNEYAYDDYSALRVTQAYGFWLRRGIDGTDDELIHAIRTFLSQYDAVWMKQTNVRYKKKSKKK